MINSESAEWQTAANIATVVATFVTIIVLCVQTWLARKERTEAIRDEVKVRKMAIISDLVAYRFVLTEAGNEIPEAALARLNFNSALSRTPVNFVENNAIMAKYSEFGSEFTGKKYHELITLMLEDALGYVPSGMTYELLLSVPTRKFDVK